MGRMLTVAEMTVRQLVRRRGMLLLFLLMPLSFYLLRRTDSTGQSVRALFLGVGWAVSTAALFATSSSREIEPRLRLAGYRSYQLYGGRLAALWLMGIGLAAPFFALAAVDLPKVRDGAVGLALLCCVAVAAPMGVLIGTVLPRELEGTLLLLITVGVQMLMDPADAASKVTPFWSSREIATYAIDYTGADYLSRGLAHAAGCTLVLLALVAVTSSVRLRQRRHVRLAPTR